MKAHTLLAAAVFTATVAADHHNRSSEVWTKTETEASGVIWRGNSSGGLTSSHDLLPSEPADGYPVSASQRVAKSLSHTAAITDKLLCAATQDDFSWGDQDGRNFLTVSLNQHVLFSPPHAVPPSVL